MAINKVCIYKDGGLKTLIDLTNDNVGANTLVHGAKAHNREGEIVEGNFATPDTKDVNTSNNGGTLVSGDMISGKTAWVKAGKVTGTMPTKRGWSASIMDRDEIIDIPEGYHDGTGKVAIAYDEGFKSENIRAGVTILGVEGTMTGNEDMKPETVKNVKASFDKSVTVTPTEGYNCLAQVTVAAIPYHEIEPGYAEGNMYGTTVIIGNRYSNE